MGNEAGYRLLSRYELGDMTARYMIGEEKQVELVLVPTVKEKDIREDILETKCLHGDSLVQVMILGDVYPGGYSGGSSLRNGPSVKSMHYEKQEVKEEDNRTIINTYLKDERGYAYIHSLGWTKGDFALDSVTSFVNESSEAVSLEMLSSFSLGQVSPFEEADAEQCLKLHRIRSKWSQEGRLVTESAEDLQLEPSWAYWQVNSVHYGQIGSMPVKGYFPFGAVEDSKAEVVWAAQLAVETSWQMEFYRRDDGLAFSGGLADREFGHWVKEIKPGESFTGPKAILTVCTGARNGEALVNRACQRLTQYADKYLASAPESEQHLPILFNEYCTTWGLPSHENIAGILEAVKDKGLEYFVIDCGWFVEEGKRWENGMGDYVPSDKLFPGGLEAVCEDIRKAGMKPGIWFEIDNVGRDAHAFHRDDLLLHRDGKILTTENRRFFDMKKPQVQAYLKEKVIDQLNRYGFEYMKMDYNDTIGIGCDGAESLGEGLRQDREASVDFVRRVRKEVPGIILENCASGGHKLEPLMMSLCSMASFSDAHECEEIPVIAAALHRSILPRQSQIWAVIRKTDSIKRIAYTVSNTFLGRMCFSGDVTELTKEQWKAIEDGMAFYHKIAPIIKDGYTYFYENREASDRHLKGWQGIVRVKESLADENGGCKEAYALVDVFRGEVPKEIVIDLPKSCPKNITDIYAPTGITAKIRGDKLVVIPTEEMEAIGVRFAES